MPVISMFYGIIISMYYIDNKRHKKPHVHVRYQGKETVISIPDGKTIEGSIKTAKLKLVIAWIEIHKEELMADWELAKKGENVFPIEPLR